MNVNRRKQNRLIALVTLVVALLAPQMIACADTNSEPDTPGRGAVVQSPIAPSAGLCHVSDDYEIPAAVYFNGTRAHVLETQRSQGGYPTALTDPEEQWALVRIDVPEGSESIEGWIPEVALRYDEAETEAQTIEVAATALDDPTPLYADNGLTDRVLAQLPAGAPLRVLGVMRDWLHVQVDGKAGFVSKAQAQFDADNLKRYQAGLPANGLDDIMPGHLARYEEYGQKLSEALGMLDKEESSKALEARAKASALAQEYGFQFMEYINVLPGPDDLTVEQAVTIAKEQLMARYHYTPQDILGFWLNFFHWPDKENERFWNIGLLAGRGKGNLRIMLNQQGEPVEFFKAEDYPARDEPPVSPEQLRQMQQHIPYYTEHHYEDLPAQGDISREDAILKAWGALEAGALGAAADSYKVYGATFHRKAQDNISWWMVAFLPKDAPADTPMYHVAVLAPGGETLVTEDAPAYLQALEGEEREGITQEEAIRLGAEHLAATQDVDLQALLQAQHDAQRTTWPLHPDRQVWVVYYPLDKSWLNTYSVILDAYTGEILEIHTPENISNG